MTSSPDCGDRLRVLHLMVSLGPGTSGYYEHSLPVIDERDLTLCTYFTPVITPEPQIRLYAGNGTVRGFSRAFRQALRADEYDVVHAHSPHMVLFLIVAMLARIRPGLRRRSVCTVHGSFPGFKARNKLLLFLSLGVFSRVVFCSHAARASLPRILERLVGGRARVVQNGVDLEHVDRVIEDISPNHNGNFTVLSIGRLIPIKDPPTLLRAFAQSGGDDDRLTFIGDGSLRPQLESAIAEARLGDRVALAGLVDRAKVFRHLVDSDVCVSASHSEGLPLAALEAMACSVPVILSDIPAHREFQADAAVIPLVPPGDVAGFSRELARMRSMSGDERAAIGKACRELVESGFSLGRMIQGYERVYREIQSIGSSS